MSAPLFNDLFSQVNDDDILQLVRGAVPKIVGNNLVYKEHFLRAIDEFESGENPYELPLFLQLRRYPADIEEFIFSSEYLGRPRREIYPAVLDELCLINNPDGYRLTNPYTEAVFTGGIGPLSADTEFLTPSGWVRMDSYVPGMLVAEYNPASTQLEFRAPRDYTVKSCSWFWHFQTKYGVDMKLSPLHRTLYRDTRGNLQVAPADEVARRCLENAHGFSGNVLTTFSPPVRAGVPFSDAQLRLMVAVQADGNFNRTRPLSTYCRILLQKDRKKDRLRQLLVEAGVPFSERPVLSRVGFSSFTFHAPLRSKDFEWAWDASSAQLQIMVDEFNHWDGSFSDGRYATTCKKSADFAQYALSSCGLRSVISETPNESSLCLGTPKTLYRVGASSRIEPSMQQVGGGGVSKVPSLDGKMYCFETTTTFFVARCNGRVFITGNSAKSTSAIYTNAYQTYLISCFNNPHSTFGLDSTSEILFVFQSLTGEHAENGDYARFRELCEQSAYFRTVFPFDRRNKKTLKFPSRIEVRPIGSDTGAIGSNVIGGMIEEMNFMKITEKSKKSIDKGVYNQALTIYNGLARRRKSRFLDAGRMPGILCLVSSKRYPGEFTDTKIEEAKKDPSIYIYDKRVWDIKPQGTFSQGWFQVFIGDLTRKAHIIAPGEQVSLKDLELVTTVPNDFRSDFETDLIGSLRDIAGVGTLARYPFVQNVGAVGEAFGKVKNVFGEQETDFMQPLDMLLSNISHPDLPRWCHIDLAVTGDSCGMTIGHVPGFKSMDKMTDGVQDQEMMPIIRIDGMLRIKPPKDDEIKFFKVREILYVLRAKGINIKWVTFDSFQSVDSQQILRSKGFVTGKQSVDTDNSPYEFTKMAMYEGRLEAPDHPWCVKELLSLEKDTKTGKIDHPANGSKDVSDSLAGVVYGLTMRREIWGMFNIPIQTLINRVSSAQIEAANKPKKGEE